MTLEMFIASLLFSAGSAGAVYYLLSTKMTSDRLGQPSSNITREDINDLDSEINDLITKLNHVANSHVDTVEDRYVELKSVVKLANDQIGKMNTLIADMEIMARQLRDQLRGFDQLSDEDISDAISRNASVNRPDTRVEDEAVSRDDQTVQARLSKVSKPVRKVDVRRTENLDETLLELADQGVSVEEIAARTGIQQNAVGMRLRRLGHMGHVKLIDADGRARHFEN